MRWQPLLAHHSWRHYGRTPTIELMLLRLLMSNHIEGRRRKTLPTMASMRNLVVAHVVHPDEGVTLWAHRHPLRLLEHSRMPDHRPVVAAKSKPRQGRQPRRPRASCSYQGWRT